MLDTHPHKGSKLRMGGAIHPLPVCVVTVCTDTTGPFTIFAARYTVPIVLLSIAVILSTVPLHSIRHAKRAFPLRFFGKVTFQFPTFYGTRMFITVFTTVRQPQCTPRTTILAHSDSI